MPDVAGLDTSDPAAHIRATEVTTGTELSVDKLRERTSLDVVASPDVATRYDAPRDLTIYEGDVGQFYAANFQVWFSADGSDDEVVLVERVYVINGWRH